jgi:putative oxidoreductase
MKASSIISWVLRVVAAIILLQTLYYKFSGAPESVAIFSKLHMEPVGRIGVGVVELITAILLLLPKTAFWGGFVGAGNMAGAIAAHLLVLGIESAGDGGLLFFYACAVFVCCAITAIQFRQQGFDLYNKILGKAR